MAGCQDDNDGTDNIDDGRKCGPNITGHKYRCSVCLKSCPPLLPDNCTPIPVCLECWKQISPTNKLTVISFFRSQQSMSQIAAAIREFTASKPITGKSPFGNN